jgi:hypothetical protein
VNCTHTLSNALRHVLHAYTTKLQPPGTQRDHAALHSRNYAARQEGQPTANATLALTTGTTPARPDERIVRRANCSGDTVHATHCEGRVCDACLTTNMLHGDRLFANAIVTHARRLHPMLVDAQLLQHRRCGRGRQVIFGIVVDLILIRGILQLSMARVVQRGLHGRRMIAHFIQLQLQCQRP